MSTGSYRVCLMSPTDSINTRTPIAATAPKRQRNRIVPHPRSLHFQDRWHMRSGLISDSLSLRALSRS